MGESETPWALVTRLRASGAAIEQIVSALKDRGLAREDIELLLQDDDAYLAWARGRPAAQVEAPKPRVAAPPTDVARVLRWVVITLSALVSGGALAVADGARGVGVSMGAALPAIALLVIEFRRGVRRTAKPLGFVLFFAFIGAAVSGFIAGWDGPALVGTLLFLSSVPLIVWASRTGAQLTGVGEFAPGAAVFETSDVQFTVSWAPEPVGPGEFVEVRLLAQNCVDVARRVQIDVKGGVGSPLTPLTYFETIDPGCIVEVLLPVAVPVIADKMFSFRFDLQVTGAKAGQRVRLDRGHEWVSPDSMVVTNVLGAATLLGAGVGVFALGSNGVISVKLDDARATPISARSVVSRERYRPTPAALLAASRS